jgi:SulP family sulfate permease
LYTNLKMGNANPEPPNTVNSSPSSSSDEDNVNRSFNHPKAKSPRKLKKQKTKLITEKDDAPQLGPLSVRIPIGILYGMINAAVVLPVMMSFGTIIYHDPVFSPYLPTLIKLTLVSSMVHQLCFSTFSSLPYSIGQVQDAGLIFLSAISSSFSSLAVQGNWKHRELLATTTIGLSLCTASLGLGLMLIGRCRLARFVQYLPTPVVGGYLAYIGFFCGQSGLGLMAGTEVKGLSEWPKLMEDGNWKLVLPGVFGGLFIYITGERLEGSLVVVASLFL